MNEFTVITDKLKNLPGKPGVYLFKNEKGRVIYIGKAKILRNRVRSYFQKSRPLDAKLLALVSKVHDLEFIVTDSEVEALILEANLIKKHKPRYNINLKDDKSFPYIRITAEDFPQIFATRKVIRDGSVYFGPYTNVKEMRFALNTLKKIFTIRSCKYALTPDTIARRKINLCLDFYINKCKGPCQGLQTKDDYAQMIRMIRKFLRGSTGELLSALRDEMQEFSSQQRYEDAARVRDKIEVLEKYRNAQKVVSDDMRDRDVLAVATEDDDACAVVFKIREGKIIGRVHYYMSGVQDKASSEIIGYFLNQYYAGTDEIPGELFLQDEPRQLEVIVDWLSARLEQKVRIVIPQIGSKKKLMDMCIRNARYLLQELQIQRMKARDNLPHVLHALQRDLRLHTPPRRIECFDISNIQGTDPVASMVCFVNGRPKKSEYRKFKIRTKNTPDDFAMMREVVERRYSRILNENGTMPDLIVVDGGKGQLSSAKTILNNLGLDEQPVIGMAKRLEEIFLPGSGDAQTLPRTSSSLKLLQQLRDEAHRFAVGFHRQRRKKRTLTSVLDEIPGIGKKRRELLLKTFGSVKQLSGLSAGEISEQSGIPLKLAEKLVDFLSRSK